MPAVRSFSSVGSPTSVPVVSKLERDDLAAQDAARRVGHELDRPRLRRASIATPLFIVSANSASVSKIDA